jgi:hypothetical protein
MLFRSETKLNKRLAKFVIKNVPQLIFQAECSESCSRVGQSSEYVEGQFIDAEFSYGPVSVMVRTTAHIDYETYCSGGYCVESVLGYPEVGYACCFEEPRTCMFNDPPSS